MTTSTTHLVTCTYCLAELEPCLDKKCTVDANHNFYSDSWKGFPCCVDCKPIKEQDELLQILFGGSTAEYIVKDLIRYTMSKRDAALFARGIYVRAIPNGNKANEP
jgi:hypothetical protein